MSTDNFSIQRLRLSVPVYGSPARLYGRLRHIAVHLSVKRGQVLRRLQRHRLAEQHLRPNLRGRSHSSGVRRAVSVRLDAQAILLADRERIQLDGRSSDSSDESAVHVLHARNAQRHGLEPDVVQLPSSGSLERRGRAVWLVSLPSLAPKSVI
jgi:hypothetical protein